MQTRREVLELALAVSLSGMPADPKFQVIAEPNCLSQESAEGFRAVLDARKDLPWSKHPFIVVAGSTHKRPALVGQLRSSLEQGAILIWESAGYGVDRNAQWDRAFGVKTLNKTPPSDQKYVQYRWPARALIRSFGRAIHFECAPAEAIAYIADEPVALKKQVGKGTLIVLGAMLGPHLRADDREANEVARQILMVRS